MTIRAFALRPVVVLVLAALAATGCGGSSSGGGGEPVKVSAETKELFVGKCGSCHQLSDADTSGGIGPSLDGQALDAERVEAQIAMGGGAMPPNLLEGKERDAVAKYVADASQ